MCSGSMSSLRLAMVSDNPFAVAHGFPRPRLVCPASLRDMTPASTSVEQSKAVSFVQPSAPGRTASLVSLASRVAVAPLGLGTASRSRLLTRQRSGVRLLSHMKQFMCSGSMSSLRLAMLPAGVEPAFLPSQGSVLSIERRERVLVQYHVASTFSIA